jgi:hypothetical protein
VWRGPAGRKRPAKLLRSRVHAPTYERVGCKTQILTRTPNPQLSPGVRRLTRLQPIRTTSRLDLDFAVFTQDAFRFQAIQAEANTMRRLGMTLREIGAALGVDEKTVRKALAGLAS